MEAIKRQELFTKSENGLISLKADAVRMEWSLVHLFYRMNIELT